MHRSIRSFAALACAGALLAAGPARAHYLWIEQDAGGAARLYFGEAETQLREKSPGKLDGIRGAQAFVQDANGTARPAPLARTPEYLRIDGSDASAVLIKEETLEVRDLSKHGLGVAKSNYYARHGDAAGESPLALDLKPLGGNRYALSYRGRPLAGAKLEVIAPNTWMQERKTDAQGQVDINTPWRGRYVLHLLHVDATPGEFGGKHYQFLRNHFTYSFVRSEGADPGPALSPKHED